MTTDTDAELDPGAAHDAAWEQQRREREARPNGHADPIEPECSPAAPLELVVASSLAGREPPERPWLVRDWIPHRQVTLLSGDGGVGKSIIAMQLMVAAASGTPWLGLSTMRAASFGVFAEDDDSELHRRLVGIARGPSVEIASLSSMSWRCAVADPCELVEVNSVGAVRPTNYLRQVENAIRASHAQLVVLDAATNLYGGDEIKRRQVNAFIGLLRRLAIEIDGAVLLLAHPSNAGISTGSGLSGSTHWHNAVRSRLYFERAKGDDVDPDERTLSRPKANYAGAAEVIRVRWDNGAFVAIDAPASIDRAAASAKAERVFLALLSSTYATGSWVCPNPAARNYAPTIFARHPDREGLGKPALEAAMYRLLKTHQVKTETYGRPSAPHTKLFLA